MYRTVRGYTIYCEKSKFDGGEGTGKEGSRPELTLHSFVITRFSQMQVTC